MLQFIIISCCRLLCVTKEYKNDSVETKNAYSMNKLCMEYFAVIVTNQSPKNSIWQIFCTKIYDFLVAEPLNEMF
jgi:hypothetical protein